MRTKFPDRAKALLTQPGPDGMDLCLTAFIRGHTEIVNYFESIIDKKIEYNEVVLEKNSGSSWRSLSQDIPKYNTEIESSRILIFNSLYHTKLKRYFDHLIDFEE